jgi:chitinase
MKKKILLSFLFLLAAGFAQVSAGSDKPVVLGYYPCWETGIGPDKVNYKLYTHLCHAFMRGDNQGNLKWEGTMPSKDLTTRAHKEGVKVLISLGGENTGKEFFNAMGRDPKAVEKFVNNVMEVLVKNGYDGLDVDWEFPENKDDMKHFVQLVALFKQRLKKQVPGGIITMAVPASDWSGKWYDADGLKPNVDYFNIMTYDFHGPWGSNGYNAALYPDPKDKTDDSYSYVQALKYWKEKKNVPSSQLLIGIPLFGHGFFGGFYAKSDKKTNYPDFHYTDSIELIKKGWKKSWDKDAQVPYLTSPDGKEIISYDDEKSVELKGKWAKEQGYPGIFFWDITEDAVNKIDNVLVKAARKGYLGK